MLRICSFLAFYLTFFHAQAHALTVVERSFDDLAGLADIILVGTVEDIRSELMEEGGQQQIYSYITLADLEVVKGSITSSQFLLRMSGGQVGNLAVDYPGVPRFERNMRYVLFIRGNGRDMFPLVGVMQGFFRVKADKLQRREVILNHEGHPVTGLSKGRVLAAKESRTLSGGMSKEDFIQLIRNHLPKQGKVTTAPQAQDQVP